MAFKKRLNLFRKKLMQNLTHFFLKKQNQQPINHLFVKKILVSRPNHRLGNQILMTPLLQEIENKFPNASIYLFTKGKLSKQIFKNYKSITGHYNLPKKHFSELLTYLSVWIKLAFSKFDLCINCDVNSSSGRLSCIVPKSKLVINHEFDYTLFHISKKNSDHIAIKPVIDFRIFFQFSENINTKIPKLDIKNTAEEKEYGKNILLATKKEKNLKTICIFTNATGKKSYDSTWWTAFLHEFEKNNSNYEIIELLPFENTSKVNFKYPSIYSTDIREMAGIIENVDYFITADCGVMHLACATNTTTIGLFKFKNIKKYSPYGNKNCGIMTHDLSPIEVYEKITQKITF
jgi:ADP-heptose:LPS heptosyltransferase